MAESNADFLKSKVGPLLRPLLLSVAKDRPENIEEYLIKELQKYTCPANLQALTPGWLSMNCPQISSLESFELVRELDAGVLGDAAILKLSYAGDAGDCPKTVVVKYQKPNEAQRANAVMGEFYDKECKFYKEIQPIIEYLGCRLGTPLCYGVGQNGPEDFMIVLQDLNVGYSPVSWKGYSQKQAIELIEDMAEIHAKFWGHECLVGSQINGHTEKDASGNHKFVHSWGSNLYKVLAEYPANQAAYISCMKEKFEPEMDVDKMHPLLQTLLRDMDHAAVKKFIAAMEVRLTARPRTLVHGDMRCDNAFQPDDPSARIKMIDWQTYLAAPASQECLQLLLVMENCDHSHTADNIRYLHSEMCKHRPSIAEEYPADVFYDDVVLMFCVHMYACMGVVCPVIPAIPKGNPLWLLMGYAFGTAFGNLFTALNMEETVYAFLKEAGIEIKGK